MARSAYELAAIASAAVPGITITAINAVEDEPGYESALFQENSGKTWMIRSALTPELSSHLDAELQTLQVFSPSIRTSLPFVVPSVIGSLRQENTKSYVYSHLQGNPLDVSLIEQGSQSLNNRNYAESIGRALAALHNVPTTALEASVLPSYSTQEFRRRTLKELDQAAATGKIPASLLQRWENILENTSLWHYTPTVVHGDLREDNILVNDRAVTALTNWGELHGGDPAEDFAWLSSLGNPAFNEIVNEEYQKNIHHTPDPHINERAAFHAEFALAQWLIEGLVTSDQKTIVEAQQMLQDLATGIEKIERENRNRDQHQRSRQQERAFDRRSRVVTAHDEAFDVEQEEAISRDQALANAMFLAEADSRLEEQSQEDPNSFSSVPAPPSASPARTPTNTAGSGSPTTSPSTEDTGLSSTVRRSGARSSSRISLGDGTDYSSYLPHNSAGQGSPEPFDVDQE